MSGYKLKNTQENKLMEGKSKTTEAFSYHLLGNKPKKPKFPDARYFQIHFEYLETQITETNRQLEILQRQMFEIQKLLAEQPLIKED